ncbi:MAG TPA: acyl-CoA reductase [Chitinophagaceae bacterium]
MNLQARIKLLANLGEYLNGNTDEYQSAKEKANRGNPWFTPEFIDLATANIVTAFLQPDKLNQWASRYAVPDEQPHPKNVGVVMAGNIPLVGFHDFLCVFISGHRITIKPSSKDEVLIRHMVEKLTAWEPAFSNYATLSDKLSGCDAYIATGSNNTGRYFEYYFGKYPHIIRYNRTSVAVLDGNETAEELEQLADDICLYFGRGCRNVTRLLVPANYDFIPLLERLKKYSYFQDFHKYRHNYDYQLALLMMSRKPYITDGTTILAENESMFTAISRVNYSYYQDPEAVTRALEQDSSVQVIVGHGATPFGRAQQPDLSDYADGVDTMQFLLAL